MTFRRTIFRAALLAALVATASPAWATQDNPTATKAQDLTHLHDFDFLRGDWTAHHRRLKERLAGSKEWIEFDGKVSQRPLMDGWGNTGDNLFNMPGGAYRGVSLRSYDPTTGLWSVWWLDGRDPSAKLDAPIKGQFKDGVGHFFSHDTLRGKTILTRVTWTRPSENKARWEQAFSRDGGKTWEVNWVTDFTRAN